MFVVVQLQIQAYCQRPTFTSYVLPLDLARTGAFRARVGSRIPRTVTSPFRGFADRAGATARAALSVRAAVRYVPSAVYLAPRRGGVTLFHLGADQFTEVVVVAGDGVPGRGDGGLHGPRVSSHGPPRASLMRTYTIALTSATVGVFVSGRTWPQASGG